MKFNLAKVSFDKLSKNVIDLNPKSQAYEKIKWCNDNNINHEIKSIELPYDYQLPYLDAVIFQYYIIIPSKSNALWYKMVWE